MNTATACIKILTLVSTIFLTNSNGHSQTIGQSSASYSVTADERGNVHITGHFDLSNDTIFIYMRGGNDAIPEGEADFVKNLRLIAANNDTLPLQYVGEGNWKLATMPVNKRVTIDYDILTTHDKYNWDHTGGLDETAFKTADGLFFTGYTLFIVPGTEPEDIEVRFNTPSGWKVSTPWLKNATGIFKVRNVRELVNNCLVLGRHQEVTLHLDAIELRIAIANSQAYALPLIRDLSRKLVSHYQQVFRGNPSPVYLVAINEQHMNDGSAFRRSFSLIFNEPITAEGIPAWGYLMAHEVLHLWNGQAIAPVDGLGEWFKEGATDYLANKTLFKLRLVNEDILLAKLAAISSRYWLDRFWQRDTLSVQAMGQQKSTFRFGIYGGGALLALALDIAIRKSSALHNGIEDVLPALFREFGDTNKHAYSQQDLIRVIREQTGYDASMLFAKRIDPKAILEQLGLQYNSIFEEVYLSKDPHAPSKEKILYRSLF